MYGPIQEINAKKTLKMKGQAFIVFSSVPIAEKAMSELQGFSFLGGNISIQFSKSISHSTLKEQGQYHSDIQKDRLREKKRRLDIERESAKETLQENLDALKTQEPEEAEATPTDTISNTLLIENLTSNTDNEMLRELFKQYTGLKKVTIFEGNKAGAVEFESGEEAQRAMKGLQGFPLSKSHAINLSFKV